MYEIRAAEDPDEIREGVEVIKKAWGAIDLSTIVKDIITAIQSNGGLVLIAREKDEVVGISFGFVGYRHSRIYFYSHMTGIVKEYRGKDLGLNLKLRQKEWVKKQNIDLISWTFDPLQGLNSNFNLHKLGAVSRTYLKNHYGTMTDTLNKGLRSDRLVAEWYIDSEYVSEKLKGARKSYPDAKKAIYGKDNNGSRTLEATDLGLDEETILIEIPRNIVELKRKLPEEAMRWRIESAKVYEHYFSKGYVLVDFFIQDNINYQVATKTMPAFMDKQSIFSD